MKRLTIALALVAAAMAIPASALAWGSHHRDHHGDFARLGIGVNVHAGIQGVAKLSGTGTSFGSTTATASGARFSGSLSTTWSSAQTKTFNDNDGDADDGTLTVACASSTGSITVGNNAAANYSGKTCSWVRAGTTKYVFFGTSSTGAHAFLKENGTTVVGAVFSGDLGLHLGVFAGFHIGAWDHNH